MDGEIQTGILHGATSPGATLAAARVAQGLTVEQVAGQLRLAPFQIKAIEADDFEVLPGFVFARGYVRNYARLLNLNVALLLSAMAQQAPSNSGPLDERMLRDVKGAVMEPVRFRGLPIAAVVIAGVVGALAFYEFVLNDAYISKSIVQADPVAAPVALVVAAPDTTGVSQLVPALVLREPPAVQDSGKKSTNDAPANRGLHFLFSRESWVEVRDGVGNILFSQMNLPGTERVVQGEPPFKVTVGGAQGVQLAYNGNPVDLVAHATEDVARLRLE